MRITLILPLLYLWASVSLAQTPQVVTVKKGHPFYDAKDLPCSAGTFTVGPRLGFSNDVALDTLFLCFGDSVLIDHNGDAVFDDPIPATPAGIAYAFYRCPPTQTGSDQLVLGDTCLWPGSLNGFFATTGPANGDHWFFNTGGILNSTLFCGGSPCLIHFAPITITDYTNFALEAGCVGVNTNAAFAVVYLTPIQAFGIDVAFQGNSCIGKFRPRGGFSEWNLSALYDIRIYKQGEPNKQALIYSPPAQRRHNVDIIFSVPEPGTYVVEVRDQKSCPLMFTMNMGNCNADNNAVVKAPELISGPNSTVCVPISAENFGTIFGTSFSISWDTAYLKYKEVRNPSPAIEPFSPVSNLNENATAEGALGFTYSEFLGSGVEIPDNEVLFEVCFDVVGPIDSCAQIFFGSYPTIVNVDAAGGNQVAVTAIPGKVCIDSIPFSVGYYTVPYCDNTASIAAIIEGGVGPYVVSWQPCAGGPGSFAVSKVADTVLTLPVVEGCWVACVTDQNGFGKKICDTIDIDVPSLGVTLAVIQLPSCNGSSDGVLRAEISVDGVLVSDPTNKYAFNWNTNPPQGTQLVSGLRAGQYSVTVTDLNTGCTQLAAGTLSQPPALNISVQTGQASCPGVSDGTILATASGGTPDVLGRYLFLWEYASTCNSPQRTLDDSFNGNPYNNAGKVSGCYFVTVTDANGCFYIHPTPVEITNARNFQINTLAVNNPACANEATGSIEAEAVATPPFPNPQNTVYIFFWNPIPPTPPGPYPQSNVNQRSTLSQLPEGQYELIAFEANSGCSATATYTLTDPPPVDVAVVSQSNPLCTQPTSGTITVSASGGSGGGYTYSWSSEPPQTLPAQPNLQNLGPGTYTVTVRDARGCADSATVILALPGPPPINGIDSVSVVCGGDGCLRVIAPTGTSFTWTNSAGATIGTVAQVCQLNGGTYTVVVRDAQGCTNSATASLAEKQPLAIVDSLLKQPTCNGGIDGSIAITVGGGNPGYLYNWSNNQNTPVIFPIPAGTYTVTVTDLRNCTLVRTFVLPDPPGIVIQYNNLQPTRCADTCDGRVTLIAFYGTTPPTPANFDFEWEDGGTDSLRADLCAGFNTIIVRDPLNGCFRIDSVKIDAPPALSATLTADSVSCFGGTDGRASAVASGGNGQPYGYLWSNGQTQANATGFAAGPVTLTLTDNRGCRRVFNTTIPQPEQIQITTPIGGLAPPKCFGGNDGQITLSVSKGTPGYTYSWSGPAGPAGNTNPLPNLSAGTYTVTVADSKGCTAVQFFVLNDPPPIVGSFLPLEPIQCYGEETTLYIDTITGGAGAPYQYSIDFGVYLSPNFPISIGGGKHFITYIDRVGCEYTDSFFVFEPAPITVVFDPPTVEIELGDTLYRLIPIITGANVDTFVWKPAERLSDPKQLEPFVRTFESQKYTLTVYDANGCSAAGSVTVIIDPNRNVYIPNVFVPGNTRGLNDYFNPNVGLGVEVVNFMRIFDRWGNLMYERTNFYPDNNNLAEGWDGRYKGQYVQPGVYLYVIEVKFLDGRTLLYRGDVTVIR